MAKKTPKQGSNANKKDPFGQPLADDSQRSAAPAKKDAVKKVEKADKLEKAEKKASGKTTKPAAKSSKAAPKKDSIFKKIGTYFKNVRLEIKRTTWPSRDEVLRMSLIVVGALIFFGVFIFVIDFLMTKLLEFYASLVPAVDPSATTPADTGVDPGTDAGTDTGAGTGTDAGTDAGANTGTDAGADADASTDAGTGTDAGAGTDTGTEE
jgi:preprotein translocase SecE subunit